MDSVEFACPSCEQRLTVAASALTSRVRCQRCKAVVRPVDAIDRQTALPALPIEDEPAAEEAPPSARESTRESTTESATRKETVLFGTPGASARSIKSKAPPKAAPAEPQRPASPPEAAAPPQRPPQRPPAPQRPAPPPPPRRREPPPEPSAPSLDPLPSAPSFPGAPSIDSAPSFPSAPSLPGAPSIDSAPSLDSLPSDPSFESFPSGPSQGGPASSRRIGAQKSNTRRAMLPSEPEDSVVAERTSESARRPAFPIEPIVTERKDTRPSMRPSRMSRLSRLTQHRTTLYEIAGVAERMTILTEQRLPGGIGRKVAISSAAGLALVLLAVMALVAGNVRWALMPVLFAVVCALLVYGGLRLLPRVAKRLGPRELPGKAMFWIGASLTMVAGVAAVLTWGLSEASARLANVVVPRPKLPEQEAKEKAPERADAKLERPIARMRVGSGTLWIPSTFSSEDGAYDLVMHFHGNSEVVEQSVQQVGINAVVHVTNLGIGSQQYEDYFSVPGMFEKTLAAIEERMKALGLRDAQTRRIALMSWSAGYGAVFYILQRADNLERVDSLLMMDSLHAGYLDNRTVDPLKIEPFLRFARSAMEGRKLMIMTHSAIDTNGYASTTKTADALLEAAGARRLEADPEKESPPMVTLEVAIKAMPSSTARWLVADSVAHVGDFHVYGYTGQTAEDHMAHLLQMSVTVLPPLEKRWQ